MLRLKVLSGHLSGSGSSEPKRQLVGSGCGSAASPDDVVVVHGLRTAITKAKRGAFKVASAGLNIPHGHEPLESPYIYIFEGVRKRVRATF